jgi:hypothetical protein
MQFESDLDGACQVGLFYNTGKMAISGNHRIIKIIDSAKDDRRAGEKLFTVLTHEIEGIVVGRNHDIQGDSPVFLLVRFEQKLEITIVKKPLGIHEFPMEFDIAALGLQDRLNPLDSVIGPTQPLMVGVEYKDVALMGLLRISDRSENNEKHARQG